jgi:membrane-associated HD superfamily phosphohydrolase
MLKDLFITLSLLCLCFALVIVLHSWGLQREINMLISSMLLTWALLICVDHRAFFQTSISLIIVILIMLQQYEQIVWMACSRSCIVLTKIINSWFHLRVINNVVMSPISDLVNPD